MIKSIFLPLCIFFTSAYLLIGFPTLALISHIFLVAYIIVEWSRLNRLPRFMVISCFVAILLLPIYSVTPFQIFFVAMNSAAWFATFLGAISFLREAAAKSPLVLRCGEVIMSQSPPKRYVTLSAGTFMIGTLLNLGVLHLLGGMVRQANTIEAAGGLRSVQELRNRRMFTAMTRGFATTSLGSPMTMTLALILLLVPSVEWQVVVPLGMVAMILMHLVGWLLDRQSSQPLLAAKITLKSPVPGAGLVLIKFIALGFAIFVAAISVEFLLSISLTLAIVLVSPLSAFVWIIVQNRREGLSDSIVSSANRIWYGAGEQFSNLRTEIVVLGASGLLGILMANLLPATAFAEILVHIGINGAPVALLVMLLMSILPQFGFNPVLVATLILSSIEQPELFGISPTLLALAVMAGWSLAISSSPVATTVIIAGRMAGVSPKELGWGWNGGFTFVAGVMLSCWLLLLSRLSV